MARAKGVTRASIEDLRGKIDKINRQIVTLLSRRAELTRAIGRLKPPDANAIYHPARERQVLDMVSAANPGPLTNEQIRGIFVEIISACRSLEHPIRVAFLGPEFTYSHEAAREQFGSSVDYAPQPTIAAVFSALDSGRADFGVVPIENSTEGSVTLTFDLLIDTPLVIIGEVSIPIRHALLSRDGKPTKIRKIVSHQQSLAQCRGYLTANFPEREIEAVVSNAHAAQLAAKDSRLGAIASRAAGEAYGLRLIAENIQDQAQNTTRFLVLGRTPVSRTGHDKTTIMFAVRDRVGALNEALGLFARNSINITKIESRPMRSRPWEYLFFADIAGHRDDPAVDRALRGLEQTALFLKVLGSYPEGRRAGD
jgi:chorismate mutase/prephenate dehydratase